MARIKIDFDGFDDMVKRFDEMEKDLNSAVEKALEASFDVVTPKLRATLPPHRVTGATEESLIQRPVVKWKGNVAEVKVGFDLTKDVTSQFLIYGAKANAEHNIPKRQPDMKMYEAIFGTDTAKKVSEIQREIIEGELMK